MPLFCDIAYKSSCNMLECRDQHFSIEGYSSNLVYDLNTCYIQIYLSQAYVSSKNNFTFIKFSISLSRLMGKFHCLHSENLIQPTLWKL